MDLHSVATSAKATPGATRRSISDVGAPPADLTGPYFLRYSLAEGLCPWEHGGDDLDEATVARERKQAYFEALDANVPCLQDQDVAGR